MCERLRTHVFMAPSSLSVPNEAEANKRTDLCAAWTEVDLHWHNGKLQTAADGAHNPSVSNDDECSASILDYLESCFPQTEQGPPSASMSLSHHTRFLSTWTLSQAVVLRGTRTASAAKAITPSTRPTTRTTSPLGSSASSSFTPELFPSKTASLPLSVELFSPLGNSLGAEGDCVQIQATAEGLLCSQGQDSPERPTKRARLSEELHQTSVENDGSVEAGPTTLLAQCVRPGAVYSVMVAVVHPCHLKEVKLKSGTRIPLASIVVTDQSRVEMKVALWRRAAFWVLTVSPGDVLLITELQVNEDTWRGETVLRSTYNSKLLNMGRVPAPGALTDSQKVRARSLRPLYDFLIKHRPLLVSLPVPPAQSLSCVPYASLRSLRVNTLVHMLLRVVHTQLSKEWQSEADSRSRAALERWAVVRVKQPGGQQGALVLWGAAVEWLPRLIKDTVWDFRHLLVREGTTSDSPELHSTPWSSVLALDQSDPRINSFTQTHRAAAGGGGGGGSGEALELDMRTLLSQKYSGEVELRVQIESFHFQAAPLSPEAPVVLSCSSSASDALKLLSADVTYTGCGRCAAELDTDSNGIFCPCYPCLPHTSVRCYYRPAVLGLSDRGEHQMFVQAPPVQLLKILNAPPDKLCRSSAPGSQVKLIELAAQRLLDLLSLPKRSFSVRIRSHFLCDENSVPLCQEFVLLDLQFPPSGARSSEEHDTAMIRT